MEMKKTPAAMLVLLLLVGCLVEEINCDAFDCYDACTTGCVASYINHPRLMQRCERKCAIQCSPGGLRSRYRALAGATAGRGRR
ncbi:unnamed protein product [Spirodela intermedia]|uniref:Uncharacterized protein n=2 Tax=Spirodela intermedia TaxID=51605 RepID=A0A7I8IRZ7_SPIIN|nr:unnamed protein product [Spirodela intermedia]CAA6660535.1 unnamed protein product [Spirodela intermedia]CAA7396886.1 unnamed protein product [Spirodela intermedia]